MSEDILSDTAHGLVQTPVQFGMIVPFYWKATIGASGAPTLVAADSSKGATISRTSAGLYALGFGVRGKSIVSMCGNVQNDDTTPTAHDGRNVSGAGPFDLSAGTGNILTTADDDGTAQDPPNGGTLYFKLEVRVGT